MTTTMTRPPCISNGIADGPAVYIACLASYNSGRLYGSWLDLCECRDTDDIQAGIDWIISTSPAPDAEEWAMHDHQGLPSFLTRREWPCWSDVIEYIKVVESLSCSDEEEAYRMACDNQSMALTEEDFRETFQGCYPSEEDFAQNWYEETGGLQEDHPLAAYIDWSSVWRGEFECSDFWSERGADGDVYIFRSC